jgi:hypothetical protein
MTFFDKKEEVISIELTPYGRNLMALGKLLPAYYAFFDDDILYDLECAPGQNTESSFTKEAQNLIQTRILKETPRLKTQRCLESPENLIYTSEASDQLATRPHTNLKLNYLTEPLGTSDATSVYGPAWKSTFILGEISGNVQSFLTGAARTFTRESATEISLGSSQYLKQIPQINSTIEYKMQIANTANDPPVAGQRVVPSVPVSNVWPDGTYVKLLDEEIICKLIEKEGFLLKEGLEMTVFLYDDSEIENLIPLKFKPKSTMIKNGMLLDEEAIEDISIDSSYVEYFINLNTDNDVPKDQICKGISKLKAENVEVGIEVDCTDLETVNFDIYGTRVTEIEDCD